MPPIIIAGAIAAAASVASSAIAAKGKTSSASVTPTMTPEMQALMDKLSSYSSESMDNPTAGMAPIKNAATDQINRNYMDIPNRLSSQFASRGYGSSGNFGNSLYKTAIARGGDLSNLEGQFAQAGINQRNFGASLGANLLNFGKGSTSTATSPDMSLSAGLGAGANGLSNLSTLLMLSKVLNGGTTSTPTPSLMQTGSGGTAWNDNYTPNTGSEWDGLTK